MSDDLDNQLNNDSLSQELSGNELSEQLNNNEVPGSQQQTQQNANDQNDETAEQPQDDLYSSDASLSGKTDDSDSDYTGKGGKTMQQLYEHREHEWSDDKHKDQRGKTSKSQRSQQYAKQSQGQSQQGGQNDTVLDKEQRFCIIVANLYILAKYYHIDDKLEEVTDYINDANISQLITDYQKEKRNPKQAVDAVCYNLKFQSCVFHFIEKNGLIMLRVLLIPGRLDAHTKFPETQLVDYVFNILKVIRPDSFRTYYAEVNNSEIVKYINYLARFPQQYCPRQTIKREAIQLLKQWYNELLKAKQYNNKIDVGGSSEEESGSDFLVHKRYSRAIHH